MKSASNAPKIKGQLTAEEMQKAMAWLEKKTKLPRRRHPKCEMCGSQSWEVVGYIVTPMSYGKGLAAKDGAYPQIMVSCDNCGNTKYFRAVQIGIVKTGNF